MKVEELTVLIRSCTREQFVAARPQLCLLVTARAFDDEEVGGFDTVVSSGFEGKRRSSSKHAMQVLTVEKAPGNPWPDRISVGRARNCDVSIRDPSVSKLHAHFHLREDGRYDLTDLDSQNGTSVNGRPLPSQSPETVNPGDALLFGSVSCKLLTSAQLYDLFK